MNLFNFNCKRCLLRTNLSSKVIQVPPRHIPRIRTYATNTKAPRDRAIEASQINLIDVDGTFQGAQPLHKVLQSYDTTTHTLVNLTPTNVVPTCRLYTKEALRELESKAYLKKREKSKSGGDPSKVMKECTLNWNVTAHDLAHKLDPALGALKKGNKVDISIGTKTKRHARATPTQVREELVQRVVTLCSEVGREWKGREGDFEHGVILHYLGIPPAAAAASPPTTTVSAHPTLSDATRTTKPKHVVRKVDDDDKEIRVE